MTRYYHEKENRDLIKHRHTVYEQNGTYHKKITKLRDRHWFNHLNTQKEYVENMWFKTYKKRFNDHPNFVSLLNLDFDNRHYEMSKIDHVCTLYERLDKLLVNQAAKKYSNNKDNYLDDEKKCIQKIFKQYKIIVNYILSFNDNFLHGDMWGYQNILVDKDDNLFLIDPDDFSYHNIKYGHWAKYKMYKNLADIKRIELFIINNDINISWERIRYGYLPDCCKIPVSI
tara:strand:- start:5502 stop:6185 length:684 start_codon:yes stop_codon:yes gene_type:complete